MVRRGRGAYMYHWEARSERHDLVIPQRQDFGMVLQPEKRGKGLGRSALVGATVRATMLVLFAASLAFPPAVAVAHPAGHGRSQVRPGPNTAPLAVAVMLDTSASMVYDLPDLKRAAEQFLRQMRSDDQALVGKIGGRMILTEPTSDKETLIQVVEELRHGGGTALWTGIVRGAEALEGLDGRGVVLVISEGTDTVSDDDPTDVLASLTAANAELYAVDIRSTTGRQPRQNTILQQLAEQSGGCYAYASTSEVEPTLVGFLDDLRGEDVSRTLCRN